MANLTTNPDLATGSTTVSSTPTGTYSPPGTGSTETRAWTGNGHERIHRFTGTMHRAIDSIEQRLSSAGSGMSSSQARYGEQARQYGDRMRTRMNEQPLQAVGIMLAAGVLLDRLFLRKPKVRVIQVPVLPRSTWLPGPALERRTRRWSDAADAHLQHARRTGEAAAGKFAMTSASGLAGAKAATYRLAREAAALPLQMRLATQRLMARSQEYGSRARAGMEAHPWAGLGAVLAASSLLTTALMRRRNPEPGLAYVNMDERGRDAAWRRSGYDTGRLGGMISSRPVTSAVVVLGLGMLAGMMLGRRMD